VLCVADAVRTVPQLFPIVRVPFVAAGFDEGLLSLTLSNPLCMENPYKYSKCQ
jgi:hypothetical protein